MLVGEPDERLVALARDGDERAFTAIVARYRAPLLRYCLRYLPPEGADDAVQQTFINAHAALARERGPVALRPWLYRIAHNAALNIARDPQLGLARVPESLDGPERPEDVVQQREHLDRVVAAMKALPDNQRDVIVRHELAGDSHERIAKDLGLSAGAVRQLAYRARAAVRAAAAVLIPGPLLRMLPWMSGGGSGVAESTASGPGPALAKAAVAVVIAGAAGGGAVETLSGPDGADRRPRAATPAPAARPDPAVRPGRDVDRVARPPVARSRPVSGTARRPATRRRNREAASPRVEPVESSPAPRQETEPRVDNSGPGSSSSGSGSGSSGSNSGPGSGSSGSGSGSSGSNSGPGSGSSGSGSGSSGSGSGSSESGSGSSGSGSDSSGSGSSGSGSDSSGSGSGSDESDDDSSGSG